MNTLDELIYYCKEKEPVGALMLTGEWGCGKTYLLEHQLSNALKNTHIFVRVSLFGIDSIDSLNESVKRRWIVNCTIVFSKIQDNEKAVKAGKQILGSVSNFIPVLNDIKDGIISFANSVLYLTA